MPFNFKQIKNERHFLTSFKHLMTLKIIDKKLFVEAVYLRNKIKIKGVCLWTMDPDLDPVFAGSGSG